MSCASLGPHIDKKVPVGLAFFTCLAFFLNIIQFGVFRDLPLFQLSVFLLTGFVFLYGRIFVDPFILTLVVFVLSVCFIAFLYNFYFYNLLAYCFFCFSVITTYWAGAKYNNFRIAFFSKTFVGISLLFLLLSLSEGFSIYRFSGFFDNPNGMGRFAAWTVLISVLLILFVPSSYRSKVSVTVYSFTAILSFLLLLFSNSRLALGSLVAALFGVLILVFFRRLVLLSFQNSTLYRIFFGSFLFFILCFVFYRLGFFDDLMFKFASTLEAGDFTQGRTIRWESAIPYFSMFGKGHEVYSYSGLSEVHNNYISQVLIFGWLPAIAVYILIFFLYFRSVFRFLESGFYGYIMSFSFFLFYLVYSFFETGFAILPIYLAIFFLGFADKHRKNKLSVASTT